MVTRTRIAQNGALLSVILTSAVVGIKLYAAWRSGSISVLAEGLQSCVDILMALVTYGTIRYAALPPDKKHPYGHGKAEFLSSAFQMILILASGVFILNSSYQRLIKPEEIDWGIGAYAMTFVTALNLTLAGYLSRLAIRTASSALKSEALHLRGDALSSLGVLVGVLLVGLTGRTILDPIAAILFTIIAMVLASRQLLNVLHLLMDGALPSDQIEQLETVLNTHPEVRGFHNVRTRQVGSTVFLDMHVMLDDNLTFVDAHDLAEQIEDELRECFDGSVVTIHYEPFEAESRHRREAHL